LDAFLWPLAIGYINKSDMTILITNDDGIYAPGLLALSQALAQVGKVIAIAPDRPRSASGHAITLHKPLRISHVNLADGTPAWATNGTPSDCVVLGISDILTEKPDLVVSGINPGPNLGEDLTYSGTVSAAMEGAIYGIAAFSISLADPDTLDFGPTARFAARLARALAEHALPADTFLNVNVPGCAENLITGVEITKQARRRYRGRLEKRIDPRGREYYWLGGELLREGSFAGTDVEAVEQNRISVTPVHLDFTQYNCLEELKTWRL
jgi:5'-nucleotidase